MLINLILYFIFSFSLFYIFLQLESTVSLTNPQLFLVTCDKQILSKLTNQLARFKWRKIFLGNFHEWHASSEVSSTSAGTGTRKRQLIGLICWHSRFAYRFQPTGFKQSVQVGTTFYFFSVTSFFMTELLQLEEFVFVIVAILHLPLNI